MKTSARGLALVEEQEELMLRAYDDARPHFILKAGDQVVGTLTGGYGHTGGDVHIGMTITRELASQWLAKDLCAAETEIGKCVTRTLNQNQFDALVDFTFNEGAGRLRHSTLLQRINSGAPDGVISSEFKVWDIALGRPLPDLVRRRAAEVALWETPL